MNKRMVTSYLVVTLFTYEADRLGLILNWIISKLYKRISAFA